MCLKAKGQKIKFLGIPRFFQRGGRKPFQEKIKIPRDENLYGFILIIVCSLHYQAGYAASGAGDPHTGTIRLLHRRVRAGLLLSGTEEVILSVLVLVSFSITVHSHGVQAQSGGNKKKDLFFLKDINLCWLVCSHPSLPPPQAEGGHRDAPAVSARRGHRPDQDGETVLIWLAFTIHGSERSLTVSSCLVP